MFPSINFPSVETEIAAVAYKLAAKADDLFVIGSHIGQALKSLVSFTHLACRGRRFARQAFFQKLIQTFSLSLDFSDGHRPAILRRCYNRLRENFVQHCVLLFSIIFQLLLSKATFLFRPGTFRTRAVKELENLVILLTDLSNQSNPVLRNLFPSNPPRSFSRDTKQVLPPWFFLFFFLFFVRVYPEQSSPP